jgi:ATP-dependent exoDNAse (exonuclease V) beta subunit
MKSDRPSLVDSAARARAAADLDTSFCVEAGAGTGKTSLLVSRFLSIVESGKAPCSRIVAITFTEKAAGEMKIRLRQEILKRRDDAELSLDARARLESAYDELERAPISTIHSFTAMILREHPIEAGIDPNFTQLDALEGALLFDECWGDFLLERAGSWGSALGQFRMFGGSVANLRDMAGAMYARRGERTRADSFACAHEARGTEGAISAQPAAGARAAERQPGTGASGLRDSFAGAARRLSELARDHCANPEDRGRKAIEEFVAGMEALETLRDDELDCFLLTLRLPKNKGSKDNWRPAETCAEQKAIFNDLAEVQERERIALSDRLRAHLEGFFCEFLSFVEARKAALGVLDFDDLLIKARDLCMRPDVLDALRERYRYLLVDEFQDTDPVQAEIVCLLAGPPGDRDGSRIEPGKLFIVGDPKQSIYRFRKADIEIYERVKERVAEHGAALPIVENFRSVPGIIEWVNETFSDVMGPPGAVPFQARYEAIKAHREGTGAPVARFDVEFAEGANSLEIREREGEAVARLIHRLLEEGMPVMDARSREMRPIRWGDIAVIYPGTTGIEHYEEPLRTEGIPYVVEGGKLYYTREEIRDLASAIWAIEDPYDALALVGALRSPMFGASDEEIFLFTQGGGRLNYCATEAGAAEKPDCIRAAFELLGELHRARNELGPSGTVLELLRRTKYLELSLLRPHGEQRMSNIRKAIASARAFEGRNNSFRRFARWFRDQEILASAEGESPIIEEEGDAVRLLTVHKGKGLQFPVVILANLIQGKRHSSRIMVEESGHLAFKLGLLETGDFAEIAERERLRQTAEMARVLYVAATRAGDLLVVPRMPKAGGYFDILEGHLESANVSPLPVSALPPLKGKPRAFARLRKPSRAERERSAGERAAWIEARSRILERARRAPVVIAPSKLETESIGAPPGAAEERDRKLLFGQAFHRVMELAGHSSARPVAELAASVAGELGIGDDRAELERLARIALESDLVLRAERSHRSFREVPFIVHREGNFIEGRIDLLFEERGLWTLVDYKTDDISAADLEKRAEVYRPQAAVYALALKSLGIECGGGISLYFVRPNIVKDIAFSEDLVDEAERVIREAFITPEPA